MPQIHIPGVKPAFSVLVIALAVLALAACGSSSKSSSTSTSSTASAAANTAPNSSSPNGTKPGAFAARAAALRECLSKHGIKLPQRKPGQRRGPYAAQLPAGVTRAQYESALKACGGLRRGSFAGAAGAFRTPQAKAALTKFAACMKENGVTLPKANTSGGPIFNVKGVNTRSSAFKSAETKCRVDLDALFRARPGATGPGGAPPASG